MILPGSPLICPGCFGLECRDLDLGLGLVYHGPRFYEESIAASILGEHLLSQTHEQVGII